MPAREQHLLCFTGRELYWLAGKAGTWLSARRFGADADGFSAFAAALAAAPPRPLPLLLDLLEEDFELVEAPRLFGADRRALHRRLLQRHFRERALAACSVQRRRGDREWLLLSALTHDEALAPWLDALRAAGRPAAGLWSLPRLGEKLLPALGATRGPALLVSRQAGGGLRLSFYDDGRLLLTRLAPARGPTAEQAETLQEEIGRTLRYLETQNYFDADRVLDVYLVAAANSLAALAPQLAGDTRKRYRLVDEDGLLVRLGGRRRVDAPEGLCAFAQLLVRPLPPRPHYLPETESRWLRRHRLRRAVQAAAAAVPVLAVLGAGSLWLDGRLLERRSAELRAEQARIEAAYRRAVADLEDVGLPVETVGRLVELARALEDRYGAGPEAMLRTLSQIVERHPAIRLRRIDWLRSHDPGSAFGETVPQLDRREARRLARGRLVYLFHKARVEAEAPGLADRPRQAMEAVQRFLDDLAAAAADWRVETLSAPFDLDPASRLAGRALDPGSAPVRFSFVIERRRTL